MDRQGNRTRRKSHCGIVTYGEHKSDQTLHFLSFHSPLSSQSPFDCRTIEILRLVLRSEITQTNTQTTLGQGKKKGSEEGHQTWCVRGLDILELFVLHNTDNISFPLCSFPRRTKKILLTSILYYKQKSKGIFYYTSPEDLRDTGVVKRSLFSESNVMTA